MNFADFVPPLLDNDDAAADADANAYDDQNAAAANATEPAAKGKAKKAKAKGKGKQGELFPLSSMEQSLTFPQIKRLTLQLRQMLKLALMVRESSLLSITSIPPPLSQPITTLSHATAILATPFCDRLLTLL